MATSTGPTGESDQPGNPVLIYGAASRLSKESSQPVNQAHYPTCQPGRPPNQSTRYLTQPANRAVSSTSQPGKLPNMPAGRFTRPVNRNSDTTCQPGGPPNRSTGHVTQPANRANFPTGQPGQVVQLANRDTHPIWKTGQSHQGFEVLD